MMDPLGNRVTGHRRALKCTYCARSFARTEHLTRHERSHRNEKPFSCNYCSATFTRKDVIKRHHLRYHPTIPETVGATTASRVLDSSQLAPLAINSPQEPILNCSEDVGSADTALNNDEHSPGLFMDNYTLDAILADFDFQPAPNVEFTSNPPGTVTSSRLPAQARDQLSWRGSLELSEKKRMQVYTEAESVLKSAGIKHLGDFPSRLRLERFLVAFFEFFLDYHPFLHVPTWRAEEAHSCLLLAMLVIGAGCYKDYDMAHALYCAGRHSVMTHILTSSTPETPLWATQSLVILISYGTRSGDQELFHNAVSWTSALANVIRCTGPQRKHRDWEHESEELWEDWVNNEMALRTKWAAFTALNVLTVCFHVPPALLVHEMSNVPLPCKEPEWASPTMESWLRARLARIQGRPCLGDALAALLSPSPLPTDAVSVFGTYVLLHAVLQKAWEFRQNIWLESAELTKYSEKFEVTLRRWHTCWEGNVESSVSPRNPYSAVTANPAALFRLAYTWIGVDFTPVRTAIASHSSETIELSFKQLVIPISQSDLTMRIVAHAIGALSTRVKLGMALPEQRLSCFQSFEVHLFSIECCLFSYHWLKETQNRLELEWSPEETAKIKQVREILSEVDLPASHAQKSDAVRLIYAWALILSRRAVWKLQKIVADSLERYADSL
ncbi:transcriptional regulator family: Fungal Specific TF and C2H2 zinc finger [Aspergillus niger]|nr:transcriptional regulator family: Fungal Specific TF and C2H2 zinc finger [Aspergillus niger]